MLAKCITASLFILATLFGSNAYAATPAKINAELQKLNTELTQTETEISQYDELLALKNAAINEENSKPSPEKAVFEEALAEEKRLKILAATDPSKAGEYKNASFKVTLAERKYKKANQRLDTLIKEKETLESQVVASREAAKTLSAKIAAKQQQLSSVESQLQLREQAEFEKQRQALERLRAENERLKAQQRAAAEQEALEKQRQEKEQRLAAEAAAKVPAIPDRSTRSTVSYLSDSEMIAGEKQRLATQVSAPSSDAIGTKKYLTIRIPDQMTRSITLISQGGNQYLGLSKVTSGDASLSLDNYQWSATIPAEVGSDKISFYLDLSDQAKPYLVFFKDQTE